MKRILTGILTVALAAVLAAGVSGCGQKAQPGSAAAEPVTVKLLDESDPLDFQSIKVTETGSKAYSTAYVAERTETGVHLEYYIYQNGYDEVTGEEQNETRMIHSYEGDAEDYHKLALLMGSAPLEDWDGFSGGAEEGGPSFTFDAELSDGKKVSASGTASFPGGFRDFVNILDEVCSSEIVTDETFNAGDYTLKLPKSWVGKVYAIYRDGGCAFEVRSKKKHQALVNFYEAMYDYAKRTPGYQTLVSFLKEGDLYFVKMRNMLGNRADLGKLGKEQRAICKSLESDLKKMAESFSLNGDFEIVENPESDENTDEAYITGNHNSETDYSSYSATYEEPAADSDTDTGNADDGSDSDTGNSGDDSSYDDSGDDGSYDDGGDDSSNDDSGDDGSNDNGGDDGAYDDGGDDGGGDDTDG